MLTTNIHTIQSKALTIRKADIESDKNYLCKQFTSLRPYITHGVMSLSQIASIVLAQNEMNDVKEFIKYLVWIEYCHKTWFYTLEKNPNFDILNENITDNKISPENTGLPKAILNHDTGVEFIDNRLEKFLENGLLYNLHKEFITFLVTEFGKSDWKLLAKWIYYNSLCDGIGVHSLTCQKACGALGFEKTEMTDERLKTLTDQNHTIDKEKVSELFKEIVNENELGLKTQLPTFEELEAKDFMTIEFLPDPASFRNVVLHSHWNIDPTWYNAIDDFHILVLEPSHFEKYPVSEKRIEFILELARDVIPGIHVFIGNFEDLVSSEVEAEFDMNKVVSREHPTTKHWKGRKESYEWIAPNISVENKSFDEYFEEVIQSLEVYSK